MSRFPALWSTSPRTFLAGFAGVLAALGLAVASGAGFIAPTGYPADAFAAGPQSLGNSRSGSAILTASGLTPGDSRSSTVDIANTSSQPGAFALSKSNLVDSPAAPALSSKLTLIVVDQHDPGCTSSCPADAMVYAGSVAGMSPIALGTFSPYEIHRYRFTLSFPSGSDDNAYMGAQSSVQYDFTSLS